MLQDVQGKIECLLWLSSDAGHVISPALATTINNCTIT
jgi:hypothetical protein